MRGLAVALPSAAGQFGYPFQPNSRIQENVKNSSYVLYPENLENGRA